MQRLFVLFDSRCGLCSWARRWAASQPAFVNLTFIPAGSDLARRLFPKLEHPGGDAPEELVVVSDDGGVYREADAWIMCLYALAEYREWSLRLATPALRPLARQAFALLSGQRARVSRWLGLASDAEIVAALADVEAPACTLGGPGPDREGHLRRLAEAKARAFGEPGNGGLGEP